MASPKLIVILLIVVCLSLVLAASLPVDREPTTTTTTKKHEARGDTYSGIGVPYDADAIGTCGGAHSRSEYVAALNSAQMGNNDQCGKKIRINGPKGSVTVTVVDTCPAGYCSYGEIEISTAAFQQIGDMGDGVIHITWSYV